MEDDVSKNNHRSSTAFLALVLKGMCMGAADIVPGVSGGTMAFILGIYEELILSIRTFGQKSFWMNAVHGKWNQMLIESNWKFLSAIALGIACSILTLSHILEQLLRAQPIAIWSFFFGLVAASVYVVARRVCEWKQSSVPLLIIGIAFAYGLVGIIPMETPNAWWFLILSGSIAICAMILPGISGAFILVLLGKYQFVLNAVNERKIGPILLIGIGAVLGLILFSQILGWLFKKYHNPTVIFLMGLMIGSLRKIWPWKSSGLMPENILPNENLLFGLMLILLGAGVVILIEWFAHKMQKEG